MTQMMAGVVHYALDPGAVELRQLSVPDIGEDDVLLRVGGVSVCGSDLHQYHNTQSWPVRVPVVLGHEFCGRVARIGSRVRQFKEGDRVVSETAASICGACVYCRTGEYNLCPDRLGFGYGVDGAMAEYVRVPERCLHRIPDSLSFERAALTEPCCVAYNAVAVKSRPTPGDLTVVLGPGPIGLLCAEMARLAGSGTLIVCGVRGDEERLEIARRLGAAHAINIDETRLVELVRAKGDGLGADLVIDSTGASSSLKLALETVRPAGRITKIGWGPQALDFSLDMLVKKAVTLQGSFSHTFRNWEKVIPMLASGQINVKPLISRVSQIDDWLDCFQGMDQRRYVKTVLTPTKDEG